MPCALNLLNMLTASVVVVRQMDGTGNHVVGGSGRFKFEI